MRAATDTSHHRRGERDACVCTMCCSTGWKMFRDVSLSGNLGGENKIPPKKVHNNNPLGFLSLGVWDSPSILFHGYSQSASAYVLYVHYCADRLAFILGRIRPHNLMEHVLLGREQLLSWSVCRSLSQPSSPQIPPPQPPLSGEGEQPRDRSSVAGGREREGGRQQQPSHDIVQSGTSYSLRTHSVHTHTRST